MPVGATQRQAVMLGDLIGGISKLAYILGIACTVLNSVSES
jgi:hypothetical protein